MRAAHAHSIAASCAKGGTGPQRRCILGVVSVDEASDIVKTGFGRSMLAPILPLGLVLVALTTGMNRGAVALCVLLLLVVTAVALVVLLSRPVIAQGGRLGIQGREERRGGPGGSVDLTRLTMAKSVSYQGGRVTARGLALFRTQLLLIDADGGQAMFWAWGWSPKAPLQAVLRQAISDTHARMDPMTWWRLGFVQGHGARISWVRRFI